MLRLGPLVIALGMLGITAPARAEMGDPEPARLGAAATLRSSGVARSQPLMDLSEYGGIIDEVSAREGVDPRLVRAVIQVESAYRINARSPKGAMGLMQLMPGTARQYGVANAYDPVANIEAGVRHLRSLLARFPVDLALAAYNAGAAAVERFNGIPPFPETQNYVRRVLQLAGGYRNYRSPGSRLAAARPGARPWEVRRFAYGSSSQTGSGLPLRAARGPWQQGKPVSGTAP